MATTKSKTVTAPPALRETPAELGGDARQVQAWLEDRVVRSVREKGHCGEALAIMDKVFGEPLDTDGVVDARGYYGDYASNRNIRGTNRYRAYLDSDGVDCWGNTWRDRDGYDRAGLNVNGFDREGYNKDGYDKDGFNRDGNDASGMHRDDPSRFRFSVGGYDKDGFNAAGYNRQGFNREGVDPSGRTLEVVFAFDAQGRDAEGYDFRGYHRDGHYSEAVYAKYRAARRAGL